MKAARGGIHPGQRAGCSGGPGNFNFCFNNAVPFFPSDALPRSESDPFIKETHGALLMIAGIPLRDEAHVAAPAGGLEPEDRILSASENGWHAGVQKGRRARSGEKQAF